MKFPLADWIDAHASCRHNLGESGMAGSIRHPYPTPREVAAADTEELRGILAEHLGVEPGRIFLTHGASESNAAVLQYIARSSARTPPRCRVRLPEYPPLVDFARWAGLIPAEGPGRVRLALVSQPRNPEGDLWTADRLESWWDGAEHTLVDETFREFAGTPSWARSERRRLWVTGSLTKFFAGDDVRVGFLVAPDEERERYARVHGLWFDTLANYSVAAAVAILRARERVRRQVARILDPNRAMWARAFPGAPVPRGPVGFDRDLVPDGEVLAHRCLRASVLVCSGRFFGDVGGVRLGLTRPSFPEDVRAYLGVRERLRAATLRRSRGRGRFRPARRGPAAVARASAGPA